MAFEVLLATKEACGIKGLRGWRILIWRQILIWGLNWILNWVLIRVSDLGSDSDFDLGFGFDFDLEAVKDLLCLPLFFFTIYIFLYAFSSILLLIIILLFSLFLIYTEEHLIKSMLHHIKSCQQINSNKSSNITTLHIP